MRVNRLCGEIESDKAIIMRIKALRIINRAMQSDRQVLMARVRVYHRFKILQVQQAKKPIKEVKLLSRRKKQSEAKCQS